jgi:glutamate racemase
VIRPVTELAGSFTQTGHVGILATAGTVASQSYAIEINKYFPSLKVTQEACPMWVPLVENNEFESPGADYFVKQHIDRLLQADPLIDGIILGCTHYPLLVKKIREHLPTAMTVVSQADIVAKSLVEYLARHQKMESNCSKNGRRDFYSSESEEFFNRLATIFYGQKITCCATINPADIKK